MANKLENSILGINSAYHEKSASLLRDGRSVASAENDRFLGERPIKTSSACDFWDLPFYAIDFCLRETNCSLSELKHIAYSFDPNLKIKSQLRDIAFYHGKEKWRHFCKELCFYFMNRSMPYFLAHHSPKNPSIRKRFLTMGKPSWKFHFVEHHLSHAASSFYVSPFEESAILTVDGIGESTCTLMAHGKGNQINKLKEIRFPHSLGFFYEEVTKFLGFERNRDEYKVMGLAGYGQPRFYNNLRKLVSLKPGGEYQVKIDFLRPSLFGAKELHELLGPPRLWEQPATDYHAEVAASVQKVLEETVLHVLNGLYQKTGLKNLCLAGGVALNCLMNERIRQESPFENIFIQPASHDAGTALGAALWVQHAVLNQPRKYDHELSYLGPEFANGEIQSALDAAKIFYKYSGQIETDCAQLISQGKIIGWLQGRMEWGPRALGNRSILADPRNPSAKDLVNKVKGRENFRPLAPSILEEHTSKYFYCDDPSPYMQYARAVKSDKKHLIPSVVHIDGTARLQTVCKNQNQKYYRLIQKFYELTGVPVLLNTSLNYRGKPMVCNIQQALDTFYNSGLDYLAIGDFLLSKNNREHNEYFATSERRAAVGSK